MTAEFGFRKSFISTKIQIKTYSFHYVFRLQHAAVNNFSICFKPGSYSRTVISQTDRDTEVKSVSSINKLNMPQ